MLLSVMQYTIPAFIFVEIRNDKFAINAGELVKN